MTQPTRFMECVRDMIRVRRYSIRTEQAYCYWIRYFIRFHQIQQKADLLIKKDQRVMQFLTFLAVNKKVAAATQNQALNALNFLYREVLTAPLGDVTQATRSKREPAIPVVLERREIKQLLSHLSGELADRTATLWRRASHYGVHTFTD